MTLFEFLALFDQHPEPVDHFALKACGIDDASDVHNTPGNATSSVEPAGGIMGDSGFSPFSVSSLDSPLNGGLGIGCGIDAGLGSGFGCGGFSGFGSGFGGF